MMADSSTLAVPSMTSPSLGMISPALTMTTSPFFSSLEETTSLRAVGLEQTGLGVLLGLLQALGLGLAAALSHRLGEVGEEDGDKEDDADKDVVQADIVDAVGGPEELGEDGEQQSDDKADLNHKHDRIVHHIFGVQLGERPDNRGLEDVLCYEFGPMLIFHRESVILL